MEVNIVLFFLFVLHEIVSNWNVHKTVIYDNLQMCINTKLKNTLVKGRTLISCDF